MRATKLYPFSIPAGGSVNFLVEGDYFKIKSSTGSVTATGDSFGSIAGLLQGQGLRDTDFKRITLTDETGAVNNGYLLVSDGNFVDDRVTGEVSVIDGGKARTLSGTAFILASAATSGAGTAPGIQIFNPSGSTKNIAIKSAYLSLTVGQGYQIAFANSFTGSVDTTANNLQSKKFGASSVAKVYSYTAANASANINGNNLELGIASANTMVRVLWQEPIIITPNQGLFISGTAAGVATLYGGFDYIEDQI